jgi:hypothetical protein
MSVPIAKKLTYHRRHVGYIHAGGSVKWGVRVRVFKQTKRTNRYDRKIDHPKLPLKNHQAIEQSQLQLTRAKLTYVHNKARYQKETYAGSVSYFSCPRTAAVDIDAVEHLLARAMHRESINSR